MNLETMLERLEDRADVILTPEEWNRILLEFDNEAWRHGLEPATKLAAIEAGVVGWLLPHVTGREHPVAIRIPDIEGKLQPVTPEEVATLLKDRLTS